MAEFRSITASKRLVLSFSGLFRGKSLFDETVKTMVFSMVILLLNMATGMITARMLGPEGRGILSAMILWPQFLAFAGTLGLHASLLYHLKKSPEREADLYYSATGLTLLAGIGAVMVGLWVIPLWLDQHTREIIHSGKWFMAATPFMLLFFIHNALFRGREEFHLFNRMRYLVPLLSLVLILLLAASGNMNPHTAGVAYLLPYIPVTLFAMIRAIRLYRPHLREIIRVSKRVIRYGMGSYGIDLLGNFIFYIDQIILVTLLAPGTFGLYVVAVSLSRMVNVFSLAINLVLFPKASGLDNKEAALLALRVYKISTFVAVVGAIAIMLASPFMIRLFYGSEFLESIPVFRLLLAEVVIGGAALVLGQSFMAVGKPFVVTISQAIGIVLIIPLMYGLVPQYGAIGAGVALLVPSIIRLLYVIVMFQWHFRVGFRQMFLGLEDIKWLINAIRRKNSHSITDRSVAR